MNFLSLIIVFTIIWWIVIFMVLPIGLNSQVNEVGAPLKPQLKKKMLITTGIAFVLTLGAYLLVELGGLNVRPYFDTAV
ncbi:MAG: DUF1467 family protein [Alphaproteobacteria bacterium]